MGANMMPTRKKSGRTVFGVKMGLSRRSQCCCPSTESLWLHTYCHAFNRCCRNAVSARLSVSPPWARAAASKLTRGSPALRLLCLLAVGILAGYRVAGLHLLCLRHVGQFRAVPQRQAWVQRSQWYCRALTTLLVDAATADQMSQNRRATPYLATPF